MVERLFKPVITQDCWKIIVECVDTISNPAIMNLLGVYTVQVLFDFSSYESSSPLEQKKLLLEAFLKGVKRVFEELSIPCSLIEDVVNEIEKNDYENSWEWKRKKIQSTTYSIQVEHQLDKVDLFWKIEHKDKSIRQLIQSCSAHEMDYGAKLGRLEAKGNFLYLLDKENEVVSKISVSELLGAESHLYCQVGSSEFVARVDSRDYLETGAGIDLGFDLNKAHFFDPETEDNIF